MWTKKIFFQFFSSPSWSSKHHLSVSGQQQKTNCQPQDCFLVKILLYLYVQRFKYYYVVHGNSRSVSTDDTWLIHSRTYDTAHTLSKRQFQFPKFSSLFVNPAWPAAGLRLLTDLHHAYKSSILFVYHVYGTILYNTYCTIDDITPGIRNSLSPKRTIKKNRRFCNATMYYILQTANHICSKNPRSIGYYSY